MKSEKTLKDPEKNHSDHFQGNITHNEQVNGYSMSNV